MDHQGVVVCMLHHGCGPTRVVGDVMLGRCIGRAMYSGLVCGGMVGPPFGRLGYVPTFLFSIGTGLFDAECHGDDGVWMWKWEKLRCMWEFFQWSGWCWEPIWSLEWTGHSALFDFSRDLFGHKLPMWIDPVLGEFLVDVRAVVLVEFCDFGWRCVFVVGPHVPVKARV